MRAVFASSATQRWGAEESLLTLAGGLVADGRRCELYASDPDLVGSWRRQGLGPAVLVPSPRWAATPRAVRFALWAVGFLRHCRLGAQDVVVVFSVDLAPLGWVLRLLRSPCTTVLDLHDYLPSRLGRAKLRGMAAGYRTVVAVSRYVTTQVGPSVPTVVLTRPVRPVPPVPAVPVPRSARSGLGPGDRITVGVVGRVDPDKNHALAIRAVAQLGDLYRLVVRGAASPGGAAFARRLRRQGRELLGGRVTWAGRTRREECFDGLDVLLVANDREAMGRTVLEAQIAGVPVVVPDRGGTAELVADGRNGFRFRSGDVASACAAIRRARGADARLLATARDGALRLTREDEYARRYWAAVSA